MAVTSKACMLSPPGSYDVIIAFQRRLTFRSHERHPRARASCTKGDSSRSRNLDVAGRPDGTGCGGSPS
ncbi:MAG: hypothetical protein ACRD2N_03545 [Vicinamibacterales bacterium]